MAAIPAAVAGRKSDAALQLIMLKVGGALSW